MIQLVDLDFTDEQVQLDETMFESCKFLRCVLEFDGGEVEFKHCEFEQCELRLSGAAQRTSGLLNMFFVQPERIGEIVELFSDPSFPRWLN